jgi:hypothetical protein
MAVTSEGVRATKGELDYRTCKPCEEAVLAPGPLPDESGAAFHAFSHYRDMGPHRSIRKAAQIHRAECGRSEVEARARLASWQDWASRYRWVERAAQHDVALDGKKLDGQADRAVELGRRHAEMAAAALSVLALPALVLSEKLRTDGALLRMLEPESLEDLLRLLNLARTAAQAMPSLATMEREARGLSEAVEGQTVKVVVKVDEDFRV